MPVFNGADIYSIYDWYFETEPQIYLDGATRRIPQGRVLGGGSILNALLWNRGGQGDYNDWVTLGNEGWGWSDMLPYFIRVSSVSVDDEMMLTLSHRARLIRQFFLEALLNNIQSTTTLAFTALLDLSTCRFQNISTTHLVRWYQTVYRRSC